MRDTPSCLTNTDGSVFPYGQCRSPLSAVAARVRIRRTERKVTRMPDRLTSLDLTFLKAESPATPMHVGTVDIFEPPVHGDEGFDYESLVALIRDRIAFVPRYRQRVQQIPGRFAGRTGGGSRHDAIPLRRSGCAGDASAARRCAGADAGS